MVERIFIIIAGRWKNLQVITEWKLNSIYLADLKPSLPPAAPSDGLSAAGSQ